MMCIRQDSAKLYLSIKVSDIQTKVIKAGWNLKLKCQLPNSPDLNVFHLEFFNAVQFLQN